MTNLIFTSNQHYRQHLGDVEYWYNIVNNLLIEHQLIKLPGDIKAGYNPTYPVFLTDKYVVKFYGFRNNWQDAVNIELIAHETLIKDNTVLAPAILAKGQLFRDMEDCWPYIISTRVAGDSWLNTDLTDGNKKNVAAEIGAQLAKIHKLPIDDRLSHDTEWSKLNFTQAAEHSILPKHLVSQVDDYIASLDDFDRCFVNGDIVPTHIFIDNGHLSGIIDWGDATVTDRHYELGKLMDSFDWDKRLLEIVLNTSNWPVTDTFPKQALGLALYRQAVGLTQHNTFDVFYKLPNLINLRDIENLDELADTLFGI